MKQVVDRIRSVITPSSVVSRVVALKNKAPGEFTGLCPFHQEKTPSFTVSDVKGFYHCFGCGEHGDIFSFIMKQQGYDYKTALQILAKEAGVQLPTFTPRQVEVERKMQTLAQIFEMAAIYYQEELYAKRGSEALKYLYNRGLTDETIRHFRLGYAPENQNELIDFLQKHYPAAAINASGVLGKPKTERLFNMFRGRVIFPIQNKKGEVIAFGGRSIDGSEPKYLNSAENFMFKKGSELYALNSAQQYAYKEKAIFLVEGYMDAISLYNKGVKNAVAPLGTAAKLEQIKMLWSYSAEPVICLDGDNAGKNAAKKIAYMIFPELVPGKSLKFLTITGAKDPDELISKYGKSHFLSVANDAINLSDFIYECESSSIRSKAPEHLANLKERLNALTEQINNPDLKKQYRSFFNDKFYNQFVKQQRVQKKKENTIDEALIVSSIMSAEWIYIKTIILLFLHYDDLIMDPELKNRFINLDINSKELDNLRNKILYITEMHSENLVSQELNKLKQEILEPHGDSHGDSSPGKISDFDMLSYGDDHVCAINRLFDLVELEHLEEKVRIITSKIIESPSEELFQKLKAIKELQEKFKLNLGIS